MREGGRVGGGSGWVLLDRCAGSRPRLAHLFGRTSAGFRGMMTGHSLGPTTEPRTSGVMDPCIKEQEFEISALCP